MTAVVFPETPGVSPSPEQSTRTSETMASLAKAVVYYGLLGFGLVFPIVGGLVGLLTR